MERIARVVSGRRSRRSTGSALDQVSAAALEHTGGGTVIEAEAGEEGAAYGVEIRVDGSVVDVALDANFHVVRGATEVEGTADDEDGADQIGTDKD